LEFLSERYVANDDSQLENGVNQLEKQIMYGLSYWKFSKNKKFAQSLMFEFLSTLMANRILRKPRYGVKRKLILLRDTR
jgi:hypothetical protein